MEKLIEQISIVNQQCFGRRSERLDVIDDQLNLFNEAEALSEESIMHSVSEEKLIEHFGKDVTGNCLMRVTKGSAILLHHGQWRTRSEERRVGKEC